ncbi:MAG: CHAT domain-containing protein [Spirochaetota bacterium]
MKHFLVTQNADHFSGKRSQNILLPRRDAERLARSEASIFLYDRRCCRVFGPFGAGSARKARNGKYAVRMLHDKAYRRSAFHLIDTRDFSLSPLTGPEADILTGKLRAANGSANAVLSAVRAGRSYSLTYFEHSSHPLILSSSVALSPSLIHSLRTVYRRIHEAPRTGIDARQGSRTLGASFFSALFSGSPIAERMASRTGSVYIDVDTDTGALPWELMHDGVSFLADSMLIGFIPRGEHRERTPRKQISAAIIAADGLAHAGTEANAVYEMASRCPGVTCECIRTPVTPLAFSAILSRSDIVHVISHGTGSALSLRGKYTIRDLVSASSMPAVVVLHTCTSRPVNAADTAHLAPALIRRGAHTVIASMGAVADAFDVRFVGELYASLFAGECAGTAYRNALIVSGEDAILRYRFFGASGTKL